MLITSRGWCGLSGVFWVALMMVSRPVEAQNQDPFFLSNEAALTAGAVTAVPGDSGAPWYNPAGLVTIKRDSINLNSSAYVLRFRKANDVLRLRLPNGSEDTGTLRSLEVVSVPSSLVVTKRYSEDFSLAVGVFVPQQDAFSVSADLTNASNFNGEQFDFGQRLTWSSEQTRYHLGPSASWRVSPTLRVGATLFAVYESTNLQEEFLSGSVAENDRAFIIERFNFDLTDLGMQAVLGVQWDVTPDLTLGVTWRSATVVFWRTGDFAFLNSNNRATSTEPSTVDVVTFEQNLDTKDLILARPTRLHAAVAWNYGRGYVALEGDVTAKPDDPELYGVNEPIVNARLGGVYLMTPHTQLGFGLFTDLSGSGRAENFREVAVDYYGMTAGLSMGTAHLLAESEPHDDMIFTTTIGVRYALGVGEAVGLVFEPFDNREDATTSAVEVIFHDLGLHIGSAIYF